MELGLGVIDWIVIVAYFLIVFAVAAWATLKERAGEETAADYFLAGRNVGWFVVGASLFASNIGSEHLVGLAGTAAAGGVAVAQFEVMASLVLLLLGWVFVPFYVKSGVYTMPEFLERRYSPAARWYLAIISIVAYVMTKISVTIFAGAIVFEAIGVPFWIGAFVVVVVTGVYTIFGGLRAVLYTDLMQVFVLLGGAALVTVIGLMEVGGWGALQETVGPGFMDMWRPMSDPTFPWTGILFGAPILGIWYWCTDQFIVQRTLAARGIDHARRGTIFAGYLKLLPLFIFVLPGVVVYALVQQGQIGALENPDQALPVLVQAVLPVGLRGVVVAGLLAALMSSLSSVFNSCSTLITWDIYKELRPEASERRVVWVGRIATVVLTVLGLLWIPLMQIVSGQLYTYLQSIQSYIAPPIAAVFLLGVFWRRINAPGALASLGTGFVLGLLRLVLELINGADQAGLPEGVLSAVAEINFLHFAVLLFVICVLVLMGVSLFTPAPPPEKVAGLTYATREESVEGQAEPASPEEEVSVQATASSKPPWRRTDAVLSVVLVLLVLLIWWYFS